MSVITRFAPSPTGYLHIGGARTALFNFLFAKRYGGQFLLRIEDTDHERSTEAAVAAIISGLDWLGLSHQGEIVRQSRNAARHAAVAHEMLAAGTAYRCFATPEELTAMRSAQIAAKQPQRYDRRWRDRDPAEVQARLNSGDPFVIRLRAEASGTTTVHDLVQGEVTVDNSQMDDLVLLRADGTPTYMVSVVVDDHDMSITHVIRGDDHLTNCFRQVQIYRAKGWSVPQFAHIPLIHGADGTKLSKRHGAVDLNQWRLDGYLPVAMRNYLLRLGWSHGDSEIISDEQAAAWFSLEAVGRSPSRLDAKKLNSVNGHYIQGLSAESLFAHLAAYADYPLGGGDRRSAATDLLPQEGPGLFRPDRPQTTEQDPGRAGRAGAGLFLPATGSDRQGADPGCGLSQPGARARTLAGGDRELTVRRRLCRWNLFSRWPGWGINMPRCCGSPCQARPFLRRSTIWCSSWDGRSSGTDSIFGRLERSKRFF